MLNILYYFCFPLHCLCLLSCLLLHCSLRPRTDGTSRRLLLELKLIADVGMVGFPNAGKSSIMRQLCTADAKVGRYAFTTLKPRVGVLEFLRNGSTSANVSIADLPGLVSGASGGRGKGHEFLRHVERTKVLLFVVDARRSGDLDIKGGVYQEDDDIEGHGYGIQDLKSLINELVKYDERDTGEVDAIASIDGTGGVNGAVAAMRSNSNNPLARRRAVIAVNKLDLLRSDEERKTAVENVREWVRLESKEIENTKKKCGNFDKSEATFLSHNLLFMRLRLQNLAFSVQ